MLPALVLLISFLACASPNRGAWEGEFGGNIGGTVRFEINTTGTKLTGRMEGNTQDGQPFSAELQGRLRDQYFYASFEGTTRSGGLPVAFQGLMTGELSDGEASGDWQVTLTLTGNGYKGDWRADQVSVE